jgi:hypothetical protein
MTLSSIKQRLKAATPGPWKNDCENGQVETEDWRILICERVGNSVRKADADYMYAEKISEVEKLLSYDNEDDMEFIAHSRTDIEALVACVEVMRDALEYFQHSPAYDNVIGQLIAAEQGVVQEALAACDKILGEK